MSDDTVTRLSVVSSKNANDEINRLIYANNSELKKLHPDLVEVSCVLDPQGSLECLQLQMLGANQRTPVALLVVFHFDESFSGVADIVPAWESFQKSKGIGPVDVAWTRQPKLRLQEPVNPFNKFRYQNGKQHLVVDQTLQVGTSSTNNFKPMPVMYQNRFVRIVGVKEPQLGMPVSVLDGEKTVSGTIACTSFSFAEQRDCFFINGCNNSTPGAYIVEIYKCEPEFTEVFLVGVAISVQENAGLVVGCKIQHLQAQFGLQDEFWKFPRKNNELSSTIEAVQQFLCPEMSITETEENLYMLIEHFAPKSIIVDDVICDEHKKYSEALIDFLQGKGEKPGKPPALDKKQLVMYVDNPDVFASSPKRWNNQDIVLRKYIPPASS